MNNSLLKDRVEFEYGYSVRVNNEQPGLYPVFGSNGITGYIDSYKVKGPGIIIGRKGSVGAIKFSKTNFTPTDTAYYLKIKDEKLDDVVFWYHYLQLLGLDKLNTHSSVPGLSREIAYFININPPNLLTQQKIAAVLSALDTKIELNQRINAELEAMAKTIYDYWFVQFDFPDEHGEPYKSSGGKMVWSEALKREIPAGWEVKRLGDVLKIVRGASPRPIDDYLANTGVPWIKISDATSSDNRFIIETKQFIINEGVESSRLLPPDTLILSNSASPGIPRIVKIKACVHDGWLIVDDYTCGITKEIMFHYFQHERSKIVNLGSGSIFKNLKTDYIKDLLILIPQQDILKRVAPKLKTISETIFYKTKESQTLAELRDWLLPMLMNGQVTVKTQDDIGNPNAA